MNPPRLFKFDKKRQGYSECMACFKWKQSNNIFHHEGKHWILCEPDYDDYWENTNSLSSDYKSYM